MISWRFLNILTAAIELNLIYDKFLNLLSVPIYLFNLKKPILLNITNIGMCNSFLSHDVLFLFCTYLIEIIFREKSNILQFNVLHTILHIYN